jgi:hypothetical protein
VHRLLKRPRVEPLSVFFTSPAGIVSLPLAQPAMAPSLALALARRTWRSLAGNRILALLFLNLAIQLFDGVATYVGVGLGVGEGNPLVAAAMREMGPGSGLAASKLVAVLLLGLLYGQRADRWVGPGLAIVAIAYLWLSVVPWTLILGSLLG